MWSLNETVKLVKLEGITRSIPEDFIVEEVWPSRICGIRYSFLNRLRDRLFSAHQERKEYLHFTLVKYNWDTIRALNCIRKKIGVSLKRFGIAGMKDKRALTAQRVSLWKGRAAALARLKLPDMTLKDFAYADERINLGTAVGNSFTVTIRDISNKREEIFETLSLFQYIATSQGLPNYYGPQRLSGNVEVGRAMKSGDLRLAVTLILQKVQSLLKNGDIRNIPKVFWYEKRMLHHLKKYPNDYAGALRRIPKRIRRLYIHAYQSYIFNEKLRKSVSDNLAPQTITIQGFTVPGMPELQARQLERRSFLVAKDFQTLRVFNSTVKLRFTLRKGGYASTLLSFLVRRKNLNTSAPGHPKHG